jgi:signal recognition particle subunit SRP54
MAKGKMTMDDFLNQLKSIRKMGPLKSVLGMLPGIGHQLKDLPLDEKQIDRTEAIIKSMTRTERADVNLLDNSRRRRISRGSGTEADDVSHLVRGFGMVQEMSKQLSSMGMVSRMKALMGMGGMDLTALSSAKHAPQLPGAADAGRQKPKFKQRKKKSR